MADDGMKIELEGESYAIEDFTLGELEWLEDELGCTLDEINPNSIRAATRFVTVIKRRGNPEFTVEDAQKMKLSVFDAPGDAALDAKDDARPTKRAKATASGASAKR